MESPTPTQLQVTLSAQQLVLLDEFKRVEKLSSREATLSLLLEIALEVVTGAGSRFWDKSGPSSGQEPPRR